MTFLNPILAGLGLAAVSIPIIIHLLMRRRRKPVMWAAMRFLLEAYRQHRRRLRLEQFLLLAARCLLIAFLAIALGRPLLGAAGLLGRGPVSLYLLVDNGLASSAQANDAAAATSLERHKSRAADLLQQLDTARGDRAALITLGGPAQASILPPSSDASAVRSFIEDLAPTDSATDLPGALAILRDQLDSEPSAKAGRTVVVILSDFLAGSADTQRKLAELGRRENLTLLASAPSESGPGNISITAVEPLRPVVIAPREGGAAAPAPVRIALRRSGQGVSQQASSTIRLFLETDAGRTQNRTPIGQTVARWTPGELELSASATADLGALAGAPTSAVLTATIDTDAINSDNTFRRPIEVRRALRVGLVAPRPTGQRPGLHQFRPADWFRLALAPTEDSREAEIETVEIEPANLDATRLAALDAAIITRPDSLSDDAWKRLRAFADTGGLVMITPPPEATVHLWADAMARELAVPWNIARESIEAPEDTRILPERAAAAPGDDDLLALLAPELPELAPPVFIARLLPVESTGPRRVPALLATTTGQPVILASRPGERAETEAAPAPEGRGLILLWTVAPAFEWTDLQARPLMLPLTQELIRQGVGRAKGSWSALAGSAPSLPQRTTELRASADTSRVIRVEASRAAQPLRDAGLWRALDDRGATRGLIAINADPVGALTDTQPQATINAWLAAAVAGSDIRWLDANTTIGEGGDAALAGIFDAQDSRSSALVLPLLIAALLLGILELAMARWFSHATLSPAKEAAA